MAEGEKTKVWEEAELLCEKVRDAHWKIWIKYLKNTLIWVWLELYLTPQR